MFSLLITRSIYILMVLAAYLVRNCRVSHTINFLCSPLLNSVSTTVCRYQGIIWYSKMLCKMATLPQKMQSSIAVFVYRTLVFLAFKDIRPHVNTKLCHGQHLSSCYPAFKSKLSQCIERLKLVT